MKNIATIVAIAILYIGNNIAVLDLMALAAHEPSVPWRSVSIAKHPQKAEAVTVPLRHGEARPAAADAEKRGPFPRDQGFARSIDANSPDSANQQKLAERY